MITGSRRRKSPRVLLNATLDSLSLRRESLVILRRILSESDSNRRQVGKSDTTRSALAPADGLNHLFSARDSRKHAIGNQSSTPSGITKALASSMTICRNSPKRELISWIRCQCRRGSSCKVFFHSRFLARYASKTSVNFCSVGFSGLASSD